MSMQFKHNAKTYLCLPSMFQVIPLTAPVGWALCTFRNATRLGNADFFFRMRETPGGELHVRPLIVSCYPCLRRVRASLLCSVFTVKKPWASSTCQQILRLNFWPKVWYLRTFFLEVVQYGYNLGCPPAQDAIVTTRIIIYF